MANTQKSGSASPAKRPRPRLLRLKSPGCWIYDHPQGQITIYGERGKPLTAAHVNFLLDCAKHRLLS